ncbi:hypothetical protein Tsubulata_014789 [Turnera subulata]|uniref:J domain-containing protein n=1 Tax=Turnera subulata TaxID=218843 RepID=A0A9Q0JM28_9ROSI|nr:hypothetical protein Tsubulata_014789 [Turnera subulata]
MEGNENNTQKESSLRGSPCLPDAFSPFRTCDYYKILEVDYDATDEKIRLNYRKLALVSGASALSSFLYKHQGDTAATAKFQEINEAYNVLSDPVKRFDYDLTGIYEIDKYTLREYLARFKGMILTCNGLGIDNASAWLAICLKN